MGLNFWDQEDKEHPNAIPIPVTPQTLAAALPLHCGVFLLQVPIAVHSQLSGPMSSNPDWQEKSHMEPKVKFPWRCEQFSSPCFGALSTGQVTAARRAGLRADPVHAGRSTSPCLEMGNPEVLGQFRLCLLGAGDGVLVSRSVNAWTGKCWQTQFLALQGCQCQLFEAAIVDRGFSLLGHDGSTSVMCQHVSEYQECTEQHNRVGSCLLDAGIGQAGGMALTLKAQG